MLCTYSISTASSARGNPCTDSEAKRMPRVRTRNKFVELAEKRVVKTIRAIRLVGNLSNKSNYSYTDADALKIIRALDDEVKILKRRFETGSASEGIQFKL